VPVQVGFTSYFADVIGSLVEMSWRRSSATRRRRLIVTDHASLGNSRPGVNLFGEDTRDNVRRAARSDRYNEAHGFVWKFGLRR
jgi:hypothetical protein